MRKYLPHALSSATGSSSREPTAASTSAQEVAADTKASTDTTPGGYASYLPSLNSVGGWLWRSEPTSSQEQAEVAAESAAPLHKANNAAETSTATHTYAQGVRGLFRRAISGEDDTKPSAPDEYAHQSDKHHHHLHPHLHVRGLLRKVRSGDEEEEEKAAMAAIRLWVVEKFGNVASSKDKPVRVVPVGKKRDRLVEHLCISEVERERICHQFLRARHGDAKAAIEMLKQTLIWRQRVDIESYLVNRRKHLRGSESFMPIFILSNNVACKQPVVYALPRMYDKKKVDKDALHNAVLAFFETLYFEQLYASDQIIAIMDFRGWSIRKHAPYRAVKEGIHLLQSHYPDRLGKIFLVNYPTTLRAAYTVVSPIIDGAAKEKIVWVSEDAEKTLKEYLSPKSIPTWLGGELQAKIPGVDMEKEWRTGVIS